MRRHISAGLVVLLLAIPVWAARVVVDWEADYVNVRSGPGLNSTQLGRLARGTQAVLLEDQGEWVRIRYPGGEGWVVSRSLRRLPDEAERDGQAPPRADTAMSSFAPRETVANGPREGDTPPEPGYLAEYIDKPPIVAGDRGPGILNMVSGLLLVLALLIGLGYLARRFTLRRFWGDRRRGSGIHVLATRALGPRSGLLLVEAGGIVWLLAQGPEGVRLISEIRDSDAVKRLNDQYGFLETPFEAELRRQLDENSAGVQREFGALDPSEKAPSPEARLAALRGRFKFGGNPHNP